MTGDDSIIPKINNPKRILLLLFCKELFRVSYKISMLLFEPSFHYRYFKLTDYAKLYSGLLRLLHSRSPCPYHYSPYFNYLPP